MHLPTLNALSNVKCTSQRQMHRSTRNITHLARVAARAGAVARAEVSLLGAFWVLLGGRVVPVGSSLGSLGAASKVDQARGAQEKRHPRTSKGDPKKNSRGPREIRKSLQNVCKNLHPPTPQISPRNIQNRTASLPYQSPLSKLFSG